MNTLRIAVAGTLTATALLLSVACSDASHGNSDSSSSQSHQAAENERKPQPTSATILFAGDAMTHQAQLDQAHKLGGGNGYDFSDCFTLIAPDVRNADYAVVNLETPLGGGRGGYTGFPCFSAPDSYAVALRDAGFDLFLTANNHTLDRSDAGLRRTIQALDSLGIPHTGTFKDAQTRSKLVPFIADINGIKVAFLNYTYGTNGITAKDGAEVSLIDRDAIKREIEASRKAGAELVCVCVHWGVEYQLHEHATQRSLTDFLLAQEVDMIIGGHPHVVQPMQMKQTPSGKRVPVVYSLGNFISNMKTDDTRGGALSLVYISRDGSGKVSVDSMAYDTFYAAKPDPAAHPGSALRNFTVIPSRMADSIPAAQRGWWNTFNTRATRLFDTENIDVPKRGY